MASPDFEMTQKQNSRVTEVSGAAFAIGFFFSFRLSIVLLSVRVFGSEPSTGAAVNLALGLVLLVFVCFDRFGSAQPSFSSMLLLPSIQWVFAFVAISLCSFAWSETASPLNSAAYWSGLATDVAIMIVLLRSGSAVRELHSLMKGFIWSTCVLALVAWMMPVQADLRLGDEQFFNTNEIGNLCAVTIFFAQYLARKGDGRWGHAILFLAVSLLRSLSKSTLIAFLLSEGFLIIQTDR